VSGRIVLHLDNGLGWTKPRFVAGCGVCGTELARNTNQAKTAQAAGRARCPTCGTRTARRLPATTSPATDLALTRGQPGRPGRPRWPQGQRPRSAQAGMPPATRPRSSHRPFVWKESHHGSR
jgi:DNA-directed RNA polymerase subunit RPC12/RpoP